MVILHSRSYLHERSLECPPWQPMQILSNKCANQAKYMHAEIYRVIKLDCSNNYSKLLHHSITLLKFMASDRVYNKKIREGKIRNMEDSPCRLWCCRWARIASLKKTSQSKIFLSSIKHSQLCLLHSTVKRKCLTSHSCLCRQTIE